MYRVGFGDCFLLSFPVASMLEHVLIDCGVHPQGNIGTLKQVVDNIAAETGGKLALIIATHAHQDHVSGFAAHAQVFQTFDIRQVWLPWIENPADPLGARTNQQRRTLTEMVRSHLAARPPAADEAPAVAAAVSNLSDVEAGLQVLRAGFGGAVVKYVDADFQVDNAAGITGLSAHVLWPARDERFTRRMNVDDGQRLVRQAANGDVEPANGLEPFHKKWQVKASANRYYAAITTRDRNLLADAAWRAQGLAFGLDRAANDCSVVVHFTFGSRKLLFPGDAPAKRWLSGLPMAEARQLMAELSFYKVPHHGSSNAVGGTAADLVPGAGCVAMVSTQVEPWATIPLPQLMQALAGGCRALVRSDSLPIDGAPVGPPLAELPPGFKQGAFWFDYFLPV
jgi:hypothetical protein